MVVIPHPKDGLMHLHLIDRYIRPALLLALIVAPNVSHAQTKVAVTQQSMPAELQAARASLAKYSDPLVAVKDGFFSTVACVDFPHGAIDGPVEYPPGAMGIHFLNPANIGPQLDPAKPQVLIYEQVGGKLVLTAAEWLMPVSIAGDKAPAIFGQTLAGPMNGHEPIMPAELRHYDLHVWLWKDNPRGVFTSTNAAVKCAAGAPYTVAHEGSHK
jgi:hypothetical protein